jgi:hypothetical protein
MTERVGPGAAPVSETLGQAVQTNVIRGATAQEGHSQSHDSDADGSCHHFQTVAQVTRATAATAASQHQMPHRRTSQSLVSSVEWSVRSGPLHSQVHSQSAMPPDAEITERVINAFAAAVSGLHGNPVQQRVQAAPPPPRPVAKAVRANSVRGTAQSAETLHSSSHSESGSVPSTVIRAQSLRGP